jgi:Tfp pilus assembly protein PilF
MQKRIKEAALNFSKSISLAPRKNSLACEGMAEIYSLLGEKEKAEEYLEKMY